MEPGNTDSMSATDGHEPMEMAKSVSPMETGDSNHSNDVAMETPDVAMDTDKAEESIAMETEDSAKPEPLKTNEFEAEQSDISGNVEEYDNNVNNSETDIERHDTPISPESSEQPVLQISAVQTLDAEAGSSDAQFTVETVEDNGDDSGAPSENNDEKSEVNNSDSVVLDSATAEREEPVAETDAVPVESVAGDGPVSDVDNVSGEAGGVDGSGDSGDSKQAEAAADDEPAMDRADDEKTTKSIENEKSAETSDDVSERSSIKMGESVRVKSSAAIIEHQIKVEPSESSQRCESRNSATGSVTSRSETVVSKKDKTSPPVRVKKEPADPADPAGSKSDEPAPAGDKEPGLRIESVKTVGDGEQSNSKNFATDTMDEFLGMMGMDKLNQQDKDQLPNIDTQKLVSSAPSSSSASTPPTSSKSDSADKPKHKSKKLHKCIVCSTVGKCKYNIVRNGDVKHLCNDHCFKTFRANPSQYLVAQKDTPATPEPPPKPPTPKKAPAPAPKPAEPAVRACALCQTPTNDQSMLVWQTLDVCSSGCLGKLQAKIKSNCGSCNALISESFKLAFCARDGSDVRQFCSAKCRGEFIRRTKTCSYCQNTLGDNAFMAPVNGGTTFHDFCSRDCHSAFQSRAAGLVSSLDSTPGKDNRSTGSRTTRASSGLATCVVCGRMSSYKHELSFENKVQRMCSDTCFAAFRFAKKLDSNLCDHCSLPCDSSAARFQFEGRQRKFCNLPCLYGFRSQHKKQLTCSWCANKRANLDMIELIENSKYHLFCSVNCISLFQVTIQATSNKSVSCDQCKKVVPAQYHLTMSDASVRNFCSYPCVMTFQNQFKAKPPAPPTQQKPPITTSKPTSKPNVIQRQYVTVPAPAPRVRAPPPASAPVSVPTDEGSVPIISNVMSLAPQNTKELPQVRGTLVTQAPPKLQVQKQTVTRTETLIQVPPATVMKNKGAQCKPVCLTKATTCRPHSIAKSCQTDDALGMDGIPIPIPVPIYVPVPVVFYSTPTPQPVPIPIPVPIPCFIPTGSGSADDVLANIKEIKERIPNDPFEAELLMMAEAVADVETPGASPMKNKRPTSKTEVSSTNGDVNQRGNQPPSNDQTVFSNDADMLKAAMTMAEQMTPADNQASPLDLETSLDEMVSQSTDTNKRGTKRGATRGRSRGRAKKAKVQEEEEEAAPPTPPTQPAADADCLLKFTYGVSAWKHWVRQKNSELEKALKTNPRIRLFKTELLECSADELNYALCLFVKEVRKPNGDAYAADSIHYLCLGIQAYLFNNNRADNIFTDIYYEKFTECLNEVVQRFTPKISPTGQLMCRIEEDHLWETKQLGAHSPHVLLNTLIYFNTRFFRRKTTDDHLRLAFAHVMKAWKKNPAGVHPSRTVYLRFYAPVKGRESSKKKDAEEVYEQCENTTNPLRCPVKLFEFYVSKCPESIKHRSDLFYLVPERSCVPDSPVWYSTAALGGEAMSKMLNRIKLVREIQEGVYDEN